MYLSVVLPLLFYTLAGGTREVIPYCIIGAGPAGLQLGYFLKSAGRDYIIFEKNSTAGAFFLQYPRHRTLISINKRHTGSANEEFSFRHDWNTLISHDEALRMKYYSKKLFPDADDYIRYLQDYASKLGLNIQYHTEITEISKEEDLFHLKSQKGTSHLCKVLIVSTGLWLPNIPSRIPGIEHAEGYESVSINPDDFEGKTVLILGRGNAGFETAENIVGSTNYIHMASRSRIKMAYQTHYVGDLRAINDQLVDTYQLKSLDGQFEFDFAESPMKFEKGEDGKVYLKVHIEDLHTPSWEDEFDNALTKHGYDFVIRCLGFKFDFSIFNNLTRPKSSKVGGGDKYPLIKPNYEAINIPGMFFAGTATHSLDFKKSAGAFIHGYRYTVRALFRHLEWRYSDVPWPSITLPATDLLNHMLKRINEASGPYQMFGILVDVALIRDDGTVVYLEEVPLQGFPLFKELTGHEIKSFILWNFEYGINYSGPGKDVLREDRAEGDAVFAHRSNFLHPVLYYYKDPPQSESIWVSGSLPDPDLYHHILEDFLTYWTSRTHHIIPLRRFLEAVFQTDLRDFFAETCFELILTLGDEIPLSCKQQYLQGVTIASSDGTVNFGSQEAFELMNMK